MLKKIFAVAFLVVCFSGSLASPVKKTPIKETYYQPSVDAITQLRKILLSDKRDSHIGVIVQSMKTGGILFEQNAGDFFSPASVQKLLTGIAALDYLKADYHFSTQLMTNGKIEGNVLKGDVVIKFSGDPTFKKENLKALLTVLKEKNIQTIQGRVDIDNSNYNTIAHPPGINPDDLIHAYAAPITATIIDHNYFILKFLPAVKVGSKPTLLTTLPYGAAFFDNQMQTTAQYVRNCPITIDSDFNNTYTLRGCLPQKAAHQVRGLALRDPTLYAKSLTSELLRGLRIQHEGNIDIKKAGKDFYALAIYQSPPLKKMVHTMLKESDNIIANALFKKLGQVYSQEVGSWQSGARAMKAIPNTFCK